MNMKFLSALGMGAILALSSCGADKETKEPEELFSMDNTETHSHVAEVVLSEASASGLTGIATFTDNHGSVTLTVNVSNVKTPGLHAIHLHQNGDCSAPDASSAGGHWNPTDDHHGKWDTEHFHKGDIGNIDVKADGTGSLTLTTDKWCVDCSDSTKNVVGKSIIIHEGADDFTTQPTGNAGGRIGCGVVTLK